MRRSTVVFTFLALAGCAHPRSAEQTQNAELITADEIAESHASSAYDAIVKLRGNFLSNRGKTTILGSASALPVVYIDGTEYGGLNELRNLPAGQVNTIRLYRAWESAKFGSNRTGGVIEVKTKQ
jgi:outer membrane cobalamin receptor